MAAAEILADLHLDADTHRSRRSCTMSSRTPRRPRNRSRRASAKDVAELVDGVTKLDQIKFKSREEAQAESFRKMLLAMVRDLRVILVKLADRTHNMRTIEAMAAATSAGRSRARRSRSTRPIAERLGLYNIKLELEDLGFRALYPQRYRVIERALKAARGNQKEFLDKIAQQLNAALLKSRHRGARSRRARSTCTASTRRCGASGRRSTRSSTSTACASSSTSADTCYRALGVVHSVFKPMPGRFKDYIAIPRVNGYQSLHTTLFGPNGVPIEVQIRTEDMHRVAESGIAAHWKYKEHGERSGLGAAGARARVAHQPDARCRRAAAPRNSSRASRSTCSPTRCTCSRRSGDILRLPRGATVVDFAYAVHTDIGNRCVAAKVDRRLTPLRTVLRNGQTVEIITAKGAMPNPAWVNFVVTAKARTAIRHYLKSLRRTRRSSSGGGCSTRRWPSSGCRSTM